MGREGHTLDTANNLCRGASHHGAGRDILEDHGACCHLSTLAHNDVAQHSGRGSNQHVVVDLGVPVPACLSSPCIGSSQPVGSCIFGQGEWILAGRRALEETLRPQDNAAGRHSESRVKAWTSPLHAGDFRAPCM